MKYFLIIILLTLNFKGYPQRIAGNWQEQFTHQIENFKSCKNTVDQDTKCYQKIGEMLKSLYRIDDFYSKANGRYMTVSEIYSYLEKNPQWKLLGKGFEQNTLKQAQKLANERKAVIAVYLNEEQLGQLAYILPGKLTKSGSWGMKVPNSGAFNSEVPEKSYTDKGLSYSFPRRLTTHVLVYTRKI